MADEIPRHLSGYGTDEVQLKRKIPDYDDPGPDDYIPIQVDEQGRRLIDGEPYDFWIEQNADRVDDISDILYRFENNQIDDDRRPFDFKQHAQQAASKAFEDNEGTYRDTGLTSYNETRHPGEAPGGGTLIRASATPKLFVRQRWTLSDLNASTKRASPAKKRSVPARASRTLHQPSAPR